MTWFMENVSVLAAPIHMKQKHAKSFPCDYYSTEVKIISHNSVKCMDMIVVSSRTFSHKINMAGLWA